ncbi:DUF89 domain-containing protein [Bacteroidota bacterium]
MRDTCYFCHNKTVENLINKHQPHPDLAEQFLLSINNFLNENWDQANPYLATGIYRIARNTLNQQELFKEEKYYVNALLINLYNVWKEMINKADNSFHLAAKLAVIGNIIDYGAHCVENDILNQINNLLNKEIAIDESNELYKKVITAKSILYLGDNAGEIVFDKLFIEYLNHPNITFAVRGKPVINDVTYVDAQQVGIDKYCKVMSNGYDAPSTLLEHCSEEFNQAFNKSDIVISKGQGNYEGLMVSKKEGLFFMLMAKCDPMAELLGVKKGDLVIAQNKI